MAENVLYKSQAIIIAPLLKGHKTWPFVVNLLSSVINTLDAERNINMKQMRALDTSRFQNQLRRFEDKYLNRIDAAIKTLFGIT